MAHSRELTLFSVVLVMPVFFLFFKILCSRAGSNLPALSFSLFPFRRRAVRSPSASCIVWLLTAVRLRCNSAVPTMARNNRPLFRGFAPRDEYVSGCRAGNLKWVPGTRKLALKPFSLALRAGTEGDTHRRSPVGDDACHQPFVAIC